MMIMMMINYGNCIVDEDEDDDVGNVIDKMKLLLIIIEIVIDDK
jgi:hypothetical protein